MKRLVQRFIILLAVIVVSDLCFGWIMRYVNAHAKGGDTRRHYYIANQITEDILIFGDSRAYHHYVSKMIEDSLHLSCYNCGQDATDILFSYAILQKALERYTPKAILFEFSKADVVDTTAQSSVRWLKRWYDNPNVCEVLNQAAPEEKIKMASSFYRYNSECALMISDYLFPKERENVQGFKPTRDGSIDTTLIRATTSGQNEDPLQWSPVKENLMRKFIELCRQKDIQLYFFVSPIYGTHTTNFSPALQALCDEYGYPCFIHESDSRISSHPEYFYDVVHLNNDGAYAYTEIVIQDLKRHVIYFD